LSDSSADFAQRFSKSRGGATGEKTAALARGLKPSIFFYHLKRILLHFAASQRKPENALTSLIPLAMLCFQRFRETGRCGFDSRRLHHLEHLAESSGRSRTATTVSANESKGFLKETVKV